MTTRTRSSRKRPAPQFGEPGYAAWKRAQRPAAKARRQRGSIAWHLDAGTCAVCDCSDEEACEGGCYWVDPEHRLCSTCAAELGLLFIEWLRRRR